MENQSRTLPAGEFEKFKNKAEELLAEALHQVIHSQGPDNLSDILGNADNGVIDLRRKLLRDLAENSRSE